MKITGHQTIAYPVETVWDALLDPAVLVRTIPGCERLETTGGPHLRDDRHAPVWPPSAAPTTAPARCPTSQPHESLVMRLQGAGAPGTIDATVHVSFREAERRDHGRLRRRRDRRRHGRRGRPADARLGLEADGRGVLRQRRRPRSRSPGIDARERRRPPGPPALAARSSPRPPTPPRRRTSSRASLVGAGLVLLGVARGRPLGPAAMRARVAALPVSPLRRELSLPGRSFGQEVTGRAKKSGSTGP